MTRRRLSTTVDADLLDRARALRPHATDAVIIHEALRSSTITVRAGWMPATPRTTSNRSTPDEWGDLASFREAVARS